MAVKIVIAGDLAQEELQALATLRDYLHRKQQRAVLAGRQPEKPHVISLLDTFDATTDLGTGEEWDCTSLVTRSVTAPT